MHENVHLFSATQIEVKILKQNKSMHLVILVDGVCYPNRIT